jgi:hypothetical protein
VIDFRSEWLNDLCVQWEFQDPKIEVLYHIRPLMCCLGLRFNYQLIDL